MSKQKHLQQLSIENVNYLKTTHIGGYGAGVTFTSSISEWRHSISTHLKDLKFYTPNFCRG